MQSRVHTAEPLTATSGGGPGTACTPLAAVVARVDQLLGHAVEAAASAFAAPPAADPLRGLFVSDVDAARLVHRGPEPLGGVLSFDRPVVDIASAGLPWRRVAGAFALTPAEVDVLALALVPELDLRYERVFGYLHDDVTKRRLTPDLACQLLCETFEQRLVARGLFASDAPLIRYALVKLVADPSQPQSSSIGHAIKVDDGIIDLLLGVEGIDHRIAPAAHWDIAPLRALAPESVDTVRSMLHELQSSSNTSMHFLLQGADDGLKGEIARHVAREMELPLLVIDFARLATLDMPLPEVLLLAARAGHLFGALVLWTNGDRLTAPGESNASECLESWLAAVDCLEASGNLVSVSDHALQWPTGSRKRFIVVQFAVPDAGERKRIWTSRLAEQGVELAPEDANLLGQVFRMDHGAIERAAEEALVNARWRDPAGPMVLREDLFAAARSQMSRALPRYATRIEAGHRWDDIVLPFDQVTQLRELCQRVQHRQTVHDEWGFGQRLSLGRGVAALFAGPSGTGKTMAAQIIAATLEMDLYRVEIPAVVSKYIGETEKSLDQLFREAQGTSVVLFFDEADALFGKRSEVKDAHDRYANIEISYLLQAIEQYDGLTILATNLRHNVDDAFVRRLAFSVNFPFPDVAERRRIWEKIWPDQVPLAEDIDTDFLARQFKLTGGNIRNVTLSAAFAAAADGGRVTMAHVIRGVRREFQKMGRTCVGSDFGPYYELLGSVNGAGRSAGEAQAA